MTSEAARVEHWNYKLEAWSSISEAQPNTVHRAIVQLERANKILMVVTQNIDGLHSLAGTSRDRLVELHGTNPTSTGLIRSSNARPVIFVAILIINRGATNHDGDETVSLRLDGDVVEIFPPSVDTALRQER